MKNIFLIVLTVLFSVVPPAAGKDSGSRSIASSNQFYNIEDIDKMLKEGQFIEIGLGDSNPAMSAFIREPSNPGIANRVKASDLELVQRYCDPRTVISNNRKHGTARHEGGYACYAKKFQ